MRVAIIDYGAGNLASVRRAFETCGASPAVVTAPGDIDAADAIVVPGVGHIAATRRLDESWRCRIRTRIEAGTPLLGICLGMQWLFETSDEDSEVECLGALAGRCFRLGPGVKVPHVGWNAIVRGARTSRLLSNMDGNSWAYFTHSFAAPVVDAAVGLTTHGGVAFASVVEEGVLFGAQFHPEKSGRTGLRLLTNFLDAVRSKEASC